MKKKNAPTSNASESAQDHAHSTKESRILEALKMPAGLNRFDAERIGDHCLNTTVARLRQKGWVIHSQPEIVPTRFCEAGARVLRYRCSGRVGEVR